jgi:hypothetical protein
MSSSRPNLLAHRTKGQERGKVMRLDSAGAWVPGLSGEDPNGSGDITGVKTARDLGNADDNQAATLMRKVEARRFKLGLSKTELAARLETTTNALALG